MYNSECLCIWAKVWLLGKKMKIIMHGSQECNKFRKSMSPPPPPLTFQTQVQQKEVFIILLNNFFEKQRSLFHVFEFDKHDVWLECSNGCQKILPLKSL